MSVIVRSSICTGTFSLLSGHPGREIAFRFLAVPGWWITVEDSLDEGPEPSRTHLHAGHRHIVERPPELDTRWGPSSRPMDAGENGLQFGEKPIRVSRCTAIAFQGRCTELSQLCRHLVPTGFLARAGRRGSCCF